MGVTGKDRRTTLIRSRTLLLCVIALAAWRSRPDSARFERWMIRQSAGSGAAMLAEAADAELTDYGFLSVMTLHRVPVRLRNGFSVVAGSKHDAASSGDRNTVTVRFAGVFGQWYALR